jgi:hypothetical protein
MEKSRIVMRPSNPEVINITLLEAISLTYEVLRSNDKDFEKLYTKGYNIARCMEKKEDLQVLAKIIEEYYADHPERSDRKCAFTYLLKVAGRL